MTILLPGVFRGAATQVQNQSVAAQLPVAATRTYITGSALRVPVGGLKVGAQLYWAFNMTKTAAGVATSTIDICAGLLGTTADTAQVSFTKPAGTAAIDEGLVIVEGIVRTVSATAGVIVAELVLLHNLAATGHAQIPVVAVNTISGSFDNSSESLILGLCITTGAADAITIQQVSSLLTQ